MPALHRVVPVSRRSMLEPAPPLMSRRVSPRVIPRTHAPRITRISAQVLVIGIRISRPSPPSCLGAGSCPVTSGLFEGLFKVGRCVVCGYSTGQTRCRSASTRAVIPGRFRPAGRAGEAVADRTLPHSSPGEHEKKLYRARFSPTRRNQSDRRYDEHLTRSTGN